MRFIFTLLVYLVSLSSVHAQVTPVADVPFKYSRSTVLVETMVNNEGPFTFLVDTGATACAVTPEVAETLALPQNGSGTVSAFGESRKVSMVRLDRISIGRASAENLPAMILKDSQLSQFAGQTVDGLIGTPFLNRWPVEFDYPNERLRFFPASYDVRNQPVENPWSGITPLRVKEKAGFVQVSLNGGPPKWLMLDTGATHTVISEPTAIQAGAELMPLESFSYSAFGPKKTSRYWSLKTVRVAGLTVEGAQAFTPMPWGQWKSEQLGNDALDQFRVTVDFTRKVVRLERSALAERFAGSLHGFGFTVRRDPDDKIRVAQVRPESEAHRRGFTVGDEIMEIDEDIASHYTDGSLQAILTQPQGITLAIMVRESDGDPRIERLTSRRYFRRRPSSEGNSIATSLSAVPSRPTTSSNGKAPVPEIP